MSEALNYEHACFQGGVERVFGGLRNRFHILRNTPSHPIRSHLRLVLALCGVDNFILSHDEPESTEMDFLLRLPLETLQLPFVADDLLSLSAEEDSASIPEDRKISINSGRIHL